MTAQFTNPVQSSPAGFTPVRASSVLSTLNDDGTRRWLRPRLSQGQFLSARRLVAYFLIAIFAAAPMISIHGRPLILLDIVARRFHLFGASFYPTDSLPLALLLVAFFLSIFWGTALFGRVWCGWACPQTVYMEFLFRPIERLLEGSPGRSSRCPAWLKPYAKLIKTGLYLACSFVLAHIFLSYFVSWANLRTWVFGSPLAHPIGFAVVAIVTGAMMFDFGYFREQVCLVACPYGRFQSALLDRQSLLVTYDRKRGEPRGRKRALGIRHTPQSTEMISLTVEGAAPKPAKDGDCVDCSMCVTTCPTGIDIRNGLQMECIGCAQCIDACDAVMEKLQRPLGLIRYSSQAAMEGSGFTLLRPRVFLYPCVILVIGALFTMVLLNTGIADITVTRGVGQPFSTLVNSEIRNNVRIKIVNRLEEAAEFMLSVSGIEGVHLQAESTHVRVEAGEMMTVPVEIDAPLTAFHAGKTPIQVLVTGPKGFQSRRPFMLLGPAQATDSKHELSDEHEEERKK